MCYRYTLCSLLGILLLCFIYTSSFGQVEITIPTGADTILCNGGPVTLHAVKNGRQVHSINFGATSPDDHYSVTAIPIGFLFNFFGTAHASCVVSSNGLLNFNFLNINQNAPWQLNSGQGGIPTNMAGKDAIMGCYSDIYLNAHTGGGSIDYSTVGIAPNRKFVVTFCNVPMFSNTNGCIPYPQFITFQMVLYETSNIVDVYIKNKQTCTAWNGGRAIEGVENSTGTLGTAVPSRNNLVWTAFNDGKRFTPNSTLDTYTVKTVPYTHIPDSLSPLMWFKGNPISGPLLATRDSLVVNPAVDTPTTYTVLAIDCGDTSFASVVVINSRIMSISSLTSTNSVACGAGCKGTITLHGLVPGLADSVFYTFNNIAQPPIVAIANADSTIVIPNLCAGTYSKIFVSYFCTSAPVGPVTLIDMPIVAAFADTIHYGCAGDTVLFTNHSSPVTVPLVYSWKFGDGNIDVATNPIHIYNAKGNYETQLIASFGTCYDTMTRAVPTLHPLQAANYTIDNDSSCIKNPVAFVHSSVNDQVTYLWDFGDGTIDKIANPVHAYNQTGTFHTSLKVTDFMLCRDSASLPVYVIDVYTISLPFHDTILCISDPFLMPAAITSSYSYTYEWLPADGLGNANGVYNWNTNDTACCMSVHATGAYIVQATNQCGITADTLNVQFKDCTQCEWLPSAFTPNGDGVNDYFHMITTCPIGSYSIIIVNRWGQIVFQSADIHQKWDGTYKGIPVEVGTYYYLLKITPALGGGTPTTSHGDITLIR